MVKRRGIGEFKWLVLVCIKDEISNFKLTFVMAILSNAITRISYASGRD